MTNDLISRSALLEEIKRIGGQPYSEWETLGVLALAERIPAVDAVEVVRCKECKHYHDFETHFDCNHICGMDYVRQTDFCSYGERRSDDAD